MTQPTSRRALSELPGHLGGGLDVLICSSSYEDRCLSIPLRIGQASVRHAIVLENVNINASSR